MYLPWQAGCMPDPLTEDEIENIRAKYDETGNMETVADELGHSTSTVRKYVKGEKAEEPDPEQFEGDDGRYEDESGRFDFDAMFQSETERESGVDFSRMDSGDFIEWVFTEGLPDVDVRNLGSFAGWCRHRGAIPSHSEMRELLDSMNSGIGNAERQKMIADMYWGKARDYLSARWSMGGQEVDRYVAAEDADWFNPNRDTGGQGVHGGQTTRPQTGPQSHQSPQQPPAAPGAGGNGYNQQQPRGQGPPNSNPGAPAAPPAQQQQQGQQGGGQMEMVNRMMDEMKDMQQNMMRMMQEQNSSNQQQEQEKDVTSEVQKMLELQQMLEQLEGDDGADQQIQQMMQSLQQQIDHLKQNDGGNAQMETADPMAAIAVQMAQREDTDPETVLSFLGNSTSMNDPEVKKKEIDKEIEEMKMERRQRTMNELFDNLGDVGAELLKSGIEGFSQQSQEARQQPERQQQPQQHPPAEQAEVREGEPQQRREREPMRSPQAEKHSANKPEAEPEREPEPEPEPEAEAEPEPAVTRVDEESDDEAEPQEVEA